MKLAPYRYCETRKCQIELLHFDTIQSFPIWYRDRREGRKDSWDERRVSDKEKEENEENEMTEEEEEKEEQTTRQLEAWEVGGSGSLPSG